MVRSIYAKGREVRDGLSEGTGKNSGTFREALFLCSFTLCRGSTLFPCKKMEFMEFMCDSGLPIML